jgi:hypothetical protein
MKSCKWLMFVALVSVFATVLVAQEKGGEDESGPYGMISSNWPRSIHSDWTLGRTASVFAESPNRVFVLQEGELPKLERPISVGGIPVRAAAAARQDHRLEHCVMIFDAGGRLVESWELHNHLA